MNLNKANSFALGASHPSAIYLPAVTPGYIKLTQQGATPLRELPVNFELADLAFWTGNSKLFNHKFCLHSVGSQKIGANFTSTLFDRTRGDYTIVGDSGGYQIGKGSLKGLVNLRKGMTGNAAVAAWQYDNAEARRWITGSLSTYFDYSMTIDMALWFNTKNGAKSPFHQCTDDQLIQMTLGNLQYIEANGLGKTKWLNVLQGTNPQNTIKWWDAVKHFKHGGWSLAGATGWRGGLHNMLMLLLTMRDEKAFDAGQDWLHMLGVSQPVWHMYFTACQNKLRETANPNLQFSYDSASPFILAGMLDQYAMPPELTSDERSWSVSFKQLNAVKSMANSDELAFKQNTSPLGSVLQMKHLVIKQQAHAGRRVDDVSNQLMANHNIWVYLDAGQRVHDIAFGTGQDRSRIPQNHLQALQVVEEAFDVSSPMAFIDKHKALLDAVAPMMYK